MLFWVKFKTMQISKPPSDSYIVVKTTIATDTWRNISTMVGEKIWFLNLAYDRDESLSKAVEFRFFNLISTSSGYLQEKYLISTWTIFFLNSTDEVSPIH